MARTIVYSCDRCGEIVESITAVQVKHPLLHGDKWTIDLCDACLPLFASTVERFLKPRKR